MKSLGFGRHAFSAVVAAAILGACGGGGASSSALSGSVSPQLGSPSSGSPIQHVVIMIQENRTFNDFFATYPGADGTTTAQVVAAPNCSPPINAGPITLKESNLDVTGDLNHSYGGYATAWDAGMLDAFDLVQNHNGIPECTYPYQYTNPSQIQPYWTMAQQYVLAEHMFTTQGSDSFTAHQDLIRGGTIVEPGHSMVDFPTCSGPKCKWGCDAPAGTHTSLITAGDQWRHFRGKGPYPCSNQFTSTYATLRDLLDAKGVSWKYYVPPQSTVDGKLFNAFDVIYPVRYGPEWKTNIIIPQTQIFNDISNGALPAVSWVIPDAQYSDHPGYSTDQGPSWVASVVNAIGLSSYWESTAIIVVWDDWGGFYDNMGDLNPSKYGYGGLGLRIPALVVSPYARARYISPTHYEFGSILKYIENNWNLGQLGTTDQRATSIIDCFNYLQTPIPFQQIPSLHSAAYFIHKKPSYLPVDTDM
jgi:phospholipase C